MSVHLTSEFKIDLRGLDAQVSNAINGVLRAAGRTMRDEWRAEMPKDTGAGRQSISYRVALQATSRVLTVGSKLVQVEVAEYGRRKGAKMPPYQVGSKLFSWVGRHGIVDKMFGLDRRVTTTAAAYVVARAAEAKALRAVLPDGAVRSALEAFADAVAVRTA